MWIICELLLNENFKSHRKIPFIARAVKECNINVPKTLISTFYAGVFSLI